MKRKLLLKDYSALRILKSEKSLINFVNETRSLTPKYMRLCCSPDEVDNDFLRGIMHPSVETDLKLMVETIKNTGTVEYFTDTYIKAAGDSSDCVYTSLFTLGNGDVLDGLCKLYENEFFQNSNLSGAIVLNDIYSVGEKPPFKVYFLYNIFKKDGKPFLTYTKIIQIPDICRIKINPNIRKNIIVSTLETDSVSWRPGSLVKVDSKGICVLKNRNMVHQDIVWLIKLLAFKKLAKTEIEKFSIIDDSKISKNISNFQKRLLIDELEDYIIVSCYTADWYTEILVNHDFSVVGHWRTITKNQSTPKVVFVRPYIKHGYHRKAKKDQCNIEKESL